MLSSHRLKLTSHLSYFDKNHVVQSHAYDIANGKAETHYDVVSSYGFLVGYSTAEKIIEGQADGSNNDLTPVTNCNTDLYCQILCQLVYARLLIISLIHMKAWDKEKEMGEQVKMVSHLGPLAICDLEKDSDSDTETQDEPADGL